ncbi:MAG: ATP-binding protein [Fimbriimonadales bacterium]
MKVTKETQYDHNAFLWHVLLGVACTFLAFLLRLGLDEELLGRRPYITFYLSVVVAARFGGAWSGMIATIFGGLIGLHFFSGGPDALSDPLAKFDYGVYVLISLTITLAYETLRREKASVRTTADELKQSQSRLQTLLDNSPAGIYLKDADGRYLLLNKEYGRMLGMTPEKAIGKTDADLLPANLAERLRRSDLAVLMTGAPINIEKVMVVNGEDRSFISTKFPLLDSNGWPTAVGSMSIDISDRKRLEEQLLHSQKMDSIGRLAGGIAHDFNNLLTAIIGYAELGEMRIDPDHPVASDLKQIRAAGDRAATLTAQLLAFARKHVQEVQEVDLNKLTEIMRQLLVRIVGENVRIDTDFEDDLWHVKGDPNQLEQVLVNLVVNARDAIADQGVITITTRNFVVERPFEAVDGDVERGEYALLSVSDNGSGIPKEIIENIFEPFYTTKDKGKGTGLGLATVYGVVRQHKGQLVVDSTLGEGSTFNIYLPRSSASNND